MVLTSREILYDLYCNKKLTMIEIATMYNVSHSTIWRWLKKHDIPSRPRVPFGRKCTQSTREKISRKNTGRKKTPEEIEKIRRALTGRRGPQAAAWKGGKWIDERGYIMICPPNGGRAQYEHRIIAENVLGRKLKRTESVHHINGNKGDNRHSNLIICSKSYHHWLHHKMAHLYMQNTFK